MDEYLIIDIHDIKKISKSISKSSRSIRNRLHSIIYDNDFISNQIITSYNNRPIVPNRRCGLWYVRPEQQTDSCYFKSTDGHNTQWDFSIKRLNFHLIPLIMANNGIVIVDSTRRGKKMPDALSKTVPIWCCVINAIVFGNVELHLPPETVSKIEYDLILQKIPYMVERVKDLKIMNHITLDKPLRPLWTFPGSVTYEPLGQCEEFHPVICCTSSMQYQDGELHLKGFEYVQGAADDHELWAPHHDFDHIIFWNNRASFEKLNNDEEINNLILQLVELAKLENSSSDIKDIVKFGDTNLSNGIIANKIDQVPPGLEKYEKIVIFTETYKTEFLEQFLFNHSATKKKIIFIPYSSNKKYYKKFRDILGSLIKVLQEVEKEVLVLCENGEDFSIATILCLICSQYDLDWVKSTDQLITKNFIKLQLINIMNIKQCNPQRNVLNSCNSVLM